MFKSQNERKSSDMSRSILWGALFGILISLSFVAGYLFNDWAGVTVFANTSNHNREQSYRLLDEVQALVDANYLREQPSYAEREYAAIRGMLGSFGDRYTLFIDPPVAQSESDVLAGAYGGVGVQIIRQENGQLIMFPFEDSPATTAGIQDGDILLAINNQPVSFEIRQDVIDQMLRGEVRANNGVDITLLRNGVEQTLFVPFGVINVPSVIGRMLSEDERIGYIQIIRFTNRTPEEVREVAAELSGQGARAYVLDLRNNSGGLLQESVEVASLFLDGGEILYEKNRQGERTFNATEENAAIDLPMVVLVNNGTASAAELVAGALQDRARATLIGQQTFGKGTVQQIYRLSDESSIHITSAEWFTPNRNAIDGVGLTPDIVMIPDENGREVELGEAIRQLQLQLTEQIVSAK